ncbi:hypothetical protein B0T11DRAFT_289834 [Plectosphaerella cucumerina]|uniref:Xylanolytic transcriptional activator regulatory domain-containing protein n=1 Tax=Plectosphaerella cucumerina TaxID=40658 RepID=A0A8K0TAG1_9PEZI|nr:hypothetical protein B0T11DRAFT_289834 [Plectosphaerella cucumerina]
MQSPTSEAPARDLELADLHDSTMYPSAEVMFFLLGSSRTRAGEFHSELASIISSDSFERMAFALIDEQILGHARAEYIVCVNFFSLTLTIGLESGDVSSSFRRRLKPLQKKYRRNAFAALNHISMLSTPSLSLLQALLAGAMLFQMAGNTGKCAQLSAAACLICSHLGGRFFAELAKGTSKQESLEARQCLGHCYILDKSLSMSLGRRSFLPDMDVNASMLIPPTLEMPSTPIFNVYIEFAKVQDGVALEARASSSRSPRRRVHAIQLLCHRLERIRAKIESFRSQPPHSTDHLLQGEWMGVDFTYYSIMTAIIRLHPDFSTDQSVRESCLNNARISLHALRRMELHGLESHGNHNAYCHSVSWIVLLYPLCSIFALFCHVVETSEKQDLQLLHDVTQGLSMFAEFNKSIVRVRDWCSILVLLGKSCTDDFENA